MHDCLIAFGSNEGRPGEVFAQTLIELDQTSDIGVSASSQPLSTRPVGGPKDQPAYLNAAIRLQTSRSPFEVHQRLVEIESTLGRTRRKRWGPRKIDLDLLLFDQRRIKTEDLIVPHPRMSFRRFVLQPAAEIAGEMVHVTSGLTLEQLVTHLNQRENLIVYVSPADLGGNLNFEIGSNLPPGWEFQTILPRKFREYRAKAKLVAYRTDWGELKDAGNDPLRSDIISFAGPTLELPADQEQARIEIRAAMEAMTPLSL